MQGFSVAGSWDCQHGKGAGQGFGILYDDMEKYGVFGF